jgi:hypothetical protein
MKKTTAQANMVISNYAQLTDPKPATKPQPQAKPTETKKNKPKNKPKNEKTNLPA